MGFGVPCLKLTKNFKIMTKEHQTKYEALLNNYMLPGYEATSASTPPQLLLVRSSHRYAISSYYLAGPPHLVKHVLHSTTKGHSRQRHPLELCGMPPAHSNVPTLNTSYTNSTLLYFSKESHNT